jgi:hypothetical protein
MNTMTEPNKTARAFLARPFALVPRETVISRLARAARAPVGPISTILPSTISAFPRNPVEASASSAARIVMGRVLRQRSA